MRSGLAAAMLGIGGILVSFGATIVLISLFAHNGEARLRLPAMMTLATGALVLGAVLFVGGYLLNRIGAENRSPANLS
ncbi:MAG: hypothetical protein ACJ8AB_04165 [Gemmatimonadaceae bacterium]